MVRFKINNTMFVDDLIVEFYNKIKREKILIFVNYDIDAICSLKIILKLFTDDSVQNQIISVITTNEMAKEYNEHKKIFKYVLFLNCGGTINLVKLLQPPDNVSLFVMDNHRPTHLTNIYINKQVKLLYVKESSENIPRIEDICIEQSELQNHEQPNCIKNHNGGKRRKVIKQQQQQQRQQQQQQERRRRQSANIISKYMEFSYYAKSSAMQMYQLSRKMDKNNKNIDLLWWGIVGMTEQFILNKVARLHYINDHTATKQTISDHVNHPCGGAAANSSSRDGGDCIARIISQEDLRLALYRHWNVESSIKYTMFTAVTFKLWKRNAASKLQKIFVQMGLPLRQAKRKFSTMDFDLRTQFVQTAENIFNSRQIADSTYPSFTLVCGGYSNATFQAADYVYSLLAILLDDEQPNPKICFLNALKSLDRQNKAILLKGIEKSKQFLQYIFIQVVTAIKQDEIVSAGPFLYYIINDEDDINVNYYMRTDLLWFLGTFMLRAHVTAKNTNTSKLPPLLVSAPLNDDNDGNRHCLLIGIPPISQSIPNSLFGQAFLYVAQRLNCTVYNEYFDSTVIRISLDDRQRIFDKLAECLEL